MRQTSLRADPRPPRSDGASAVCQVTLLAGLAALRPTRDLDAALARACAAAARGTGAQLASVLQYRADEDAFVLQAGVGWRRGLVGHARVSACLGTTAGLAWHTRQPVRFGALSRGSRIGGPAGPAAGSYSASVPIPGDGTYAFGILEAVRTEAGEFTRSDVLFLQAVAVGIAAAVKGHTGEGHVTGQGSGCVQLAGAPGGIGSPTGQRWQQEAQITPASG